MAECFKHDTIVEAIDGLRKDAVIAEDGIRHLFGAVATIKQLAADRAKGATK
jgi:hypothetical protein